jgi:tol-pal system protein YbgF
MSSNLPGMPLLRNSFAATCLAIVAGCLVLQACAQDYVDVEAERAAAEAKRAAEAERAAAEAESAQRAATTAPADPYGVKPAQAYPATSYGLNSAPASPAATAPGIPASGQAQGANTANLLFQVQQMQQELMRLQGIVEEQGHELRTLKAQSLERYVELDKRLSGGAGSAGAATSGTAALGAAGAVAAGDTQTRTTAAPPAAGSGRQVAEQPGEGEAYRAAYALVRGQQFDQAVAAFREFLQEYPAGKYAPNAHYWLGELYLVIEPPDLESSRQSFMLLLTQYPDNSKVPDALYKLGKVQFLKGNREKAREYLDRVIQEYGASESSAAQLAREFIDENY